jgi:hypothetical protein
MTDPIRYSIRDSGYYYALYKDEYVMLITRDRHFLMRYYYTQKGEPIPEIYQKKGYNDQDISVDKGTKN